MFRIDPADNSRIIVDTVLKKEGVQMCEEGIRKTDRRTIYTRMVIKEALLALLSKREFTEITVADLCRKAEINRGTFYRHYNNTLTVAKELFDDALKETDTVVSVIRDGQKEKRCEYPFCVFLRKNPKYQPLFFSDSLRRLAVDCLISSNRTEFSNKPENRQKLTKKEIEAFSCFQINGCLSLIRQYISESDESWERIRTIIDTMIKSADL